MKYLFFDGLREYFSMKLMSSMSSRFLNCFTAFSDERRSSWIFRWPWRIGHALTPGPLTSLLFTALRLRVIGEKQLSFKSLSKPPIGDCKDLPTAFGVEICCDVFPLLRICSRVYDLRIQENTSSTMLCGLSIGAVIVFGFSSSSFVFLKILFNISFGLFVRLSIIFGSSAPRSLSSWFVLFCNSYCPRPPWAFSL